MSLFLHNFPFLLPSERAGELQQEGSLCLIALNFNHHDICFFSDQVYMTGDNLLYVGSPAVTATSGGQQGSNDRRC